MPVQRGDKSGYIVLGDIIAQQARAALILVQEILLRRGRASSSAEGVAPLGLRGFSWKVVRAPSDSSISGGPARSHRAVRSLGCLALASYHDVVIRVGARACSLFFQAPRAAPRALIWLSSLLPFRRLPISSDISGG